MPSELPAMIAGDVPGGADELADHTSALVVLVEAGVNVALTPGGSWSLDKSTVPAKLPHGTTVTVEDAVVPCWRVNGIGEMLSRYVGTCTESATVVFAVALSELPVTVTMMLPGSASLPAVSVSKLLLSELSLHSAVTPMGKGEVTAR